MTSNRSRSARGDFEDQLGKDEKVALKKSVVEIWGPFVVVVQKKGSPSDLTRTSKGRRETTTPTDAKFIDEHYYDLFLC